MNRRGVALLLVLLAVLITAGMAAGVLVATSTQARTSGDALHSFRVQEAAERGLTLAAAAWEPESSLTMPIGATVGPNLSNYPDSTSSRAWITRLSRGSFWLTALGLGQSLGAPVPIERRVGALYGLHLPDMYLTAALSVRDSLLVTGSARVDGSDTPPPAWSAVCATPAAPVAAAAAADTSRICDGSCGVGVSRLIGTPARRLDSVAAIAVQTGQFGPVTWTSLTAHAVRVVSTGQAVTPAPSLTGSACDTTAAGNWGDPTRATPCRNRFVIVHALGDLVMDGGMGQGIILGEGDVELRNGAQFAGLILARDDLVARTGANRVWGGIVAADSRAGSGDYSVIADTTVVTYSSCSVEMALLGTAQLRRESHRGWIPVH